MTKTIDTIVDEVFTNLSETEAGQRRVGDMDELVERLNGAAERRLRERARLRARSRISFSVNTTQAKTEPLTISVRVQGVDCGFVVFGQGQRFRPSKSKTFKQHWKSEQPTLEWGDQRVSEFLVACADDARKKYAQRESSIQELLFAAMGGGDCFLQTWSGTSCGREPWERRVARGSRETVSEAPKSAAGHGPAAYDRPTAGDAVSRAVDPVRGSSWFPAGGCASI